MAEQRAGLPIYALKRELVNAVSVNQAYHSRHIRPTILTCPRCHTKRWAV